MKNPSLYAWPTAGITERIAFKTIVEFSKNGTARRVPTRLYPTYRYEVDIPVSNEVNAAAIAAIQQTYDSCWVPVYPHIRETQPAGVAVDTGGTVRPYIQAHGVIPAASLATFLAWPGSPCDTTPVEYTGTLPPGTPAKFIAPRIQARISASPVISWQTNGLSSTKLLIEPLAMFETLSLANPKTVRTIINPNWSTGITETYQDVGSLFESDYAATIAETLFRARTLQMTFTLISEAQINEFRALMLVIRGRFLPLLFKGPGDASATQWYSNTDVIEIQHINRNLATCTLSLYQLASL